MIFAPQSPTDATTDAQAVHLARTVYLMGLERAWAQYIDALSAHPVFAPKLSGVPYRGYESLSAYLEALNAQNAEIQDALGVLRGIRKELYGNEWGA